MEKEVDARKRNEDRSTQELATPVHHTTAAWQRAED